MQLKLKLKYQCLQEGDPTKSPSYFQGIRSVAEEKHNISFLGTRPGWSGVPNKQWQHHCHRGFFKMSFPHLKVKVIKKKPAHVASTFCASAKSSNQATWQ